MLFNPVAYAVTPEGAGAFGAGLGVGVGVGVGVGGGGGGGHEWVLPDALELPPNSSV